MLLLLRNLKPNRITDKNARAVDFLSHKKTHPLKPIKMADLSFIPKLLWLLLVGFADSFKLLLSNMVPSSWLPKKSIENEIAFITGGGSGFGQLLSVRLAKLGCKVVIWDVDDKGCDETIRLVTEVGGTIRKYILDVSNKDQVYRVAKNVREEVGPVTILVNNAGIAHKGAFWETTDPLFEKMMAVNTMAHVWTLRAFLPHMMETNHGHVLAVASVAGLVSIEKAAPYCASKHAVVGLMNSLSMDLLAAGRTGVKTTVVCPFFSRTRLFECDYDGYIPFIKPEDVVESMVHGILTDSEIVYVPKNFVISLFLNLIHTRSFIFKVSRFLSGEAIMNTLTAKKVFQEQKD